MQKGDKGIALNVCKTLLILTAMTVVLIALSNMIT